MLVNCSRLVPDGLLVFFPSYSALNSALAHWKVRCTTPRLHHAAPASPCCPAFTMLYHTARPAHALHARALHAPAPAPEEQREK